MRDGIATNNRKLIAPLQADNWEHGATWGDHWPIKYPTRPGRVTVAHPARDLTLGTTLSIYRQAGWR